jgi:hypothetical protein
MIIDSAYADTIKNGLNYKELFVSLVLYKRFDFGNFYFKPFSGYGKGSLEFLSEEGHFILFDHPE